MPWTSEQQHIIDNFITEIKNINWFSIAGERSETYLVIDNIYEACNTYGKPMLTAWGQESENIEKEALKKLSDAQIDSVFETVSLAIGNEVYEAVCDLSDRLGEESGEDQSGLEEEILDFIKRDTAWACIERLLDRQGFFTRVYAVNRSGHWACSWIGDYPKGNFIIM